MTDHIWFNVSKNLQKGLLEILILDLLKKQPDNCGGIADRIWQSTDIWIASIDIQGFMLRELKAKAVLKDGKYYLTDNGKETIADGIHEINKIVLLIQSQENQKEPTK